MLARGAEISGPQKDDEDFHRKIIMFNVQWHRFGRVLPGFITILTFKNPPSQFNSIDPVSQ